VSAALAAIPALPSAQDKALNLYTARHYQTDEVFYRNFTARTGITINRIEGSEDTLASRIMNEGTRSPADVFLTADAARLAREDAAGLFAPISSARLVERIPAPLRTERWVAFSRRARVIFYDRARVGPAAVQSYEDVVGPQFRGKLCVRSGGHPYMVSLTASLIQHLGEEKAEAWVKGLVANLARPPRGGDTDQLRAVAAGECEIAIANTYYYVRIMRSDKPEDRDLVNRVGLVWPNQNSWGTHMNISGGGVLKHAPHPDAALQFLEYLSSDEGQQLFAQGNNEWPVARGVPLNNPALESLGPFKADPLEVAELAKRIPLAQRLHDRLGYR
jgi:iron(III) transport system substrate-binding protein